ncbi:probable bifunctional dTTP/UTP pyrophosphatase/methyltransferase protein isoform X3 [Mustela nigripes]|uniref:probable bifunctional dTTP/UTP pyrophosphatase/methyltransferase protein isoform X3 n=1 Tax=Mustela nigripes TaxID=77151 RepID=UPI002816525D|nr:probable bifunctional dTTP/UTP pyrophosphatase/methyltransferase protein isoform X3 [Mustela nigripes]
MVLSPVIGKLLQKRVVLASASPRRREILSHAGLRFEVVPSRFKEKLDKASFPTPYAYAIETAKQKALEVARRMHQKDLRAPDVVIGADTIVTIGGLILEKPVDKQDAYRMLSRLNGKEHSVFTGVAIVHCCTTDAQLDLEVSEFHEETTVKFSELSEELLWEYIDSGEPMDKAGGYGIQALGGMLVEHVRGDFLNVVGFPLNHFCKKLVELYSPPRREDLRRVKHDSIPPVDTFENPSDVEGSGSDPAQGDDGGGHGRAEADGDRTQAPAGPQGTDSHGTGESPPPFPAGLLELIDGFKASKALFVACKLNVFDVLKVDGPLKAVDIAGKIDASVCGTERLLDVCVALGLLEKTDRGYRNTELADVHLASDGEYSLHSLATHSNDHFWSLFTDLELAVREGASAAFGRKAEEPVQSKHKTLQFMRAMHGFAMLTAHQVATAFDLSQFTSACDLGGCTGALARALTQEYPCLTQVTVFDLPEVIEHVTCFQPEGRRTDRISFMPGDFFKDDLPEADLYILSRILHEWPDDKVCELLSRVSSRCKPGVSP